MNIDKYIKKEKDLSVTLDDDVDYLVHDFAVEDLRKGSEQVVLRRLFDSEPILVGAKRIEDALKDKKNIDYLDKRKIIKFRKHLVEPILNRKKIRTWRLFDDKDLKIEDRLKFLEWESKEHFASAKIVKVEEKAIIDITTEEMERDGWKDTEEVLRLNKKYYGDRVNLDTMVKIIKFKLLT